MLHRKEALSLVGQGWPITKISEHMGMAVQSVRRLLRQALATDSLFPSSLTPEAVAELRQLQAELLATSRQRALETQAVVNGRVGTSRERNGDAVAVAKLLEAVTRAVDLESDLFGTRQPTKIIEAQLRYQELRVDGRIKVEFDREQLRPKWKPLEITEGDGNGVIAEGSCNAFLGNGNSGNGDRSERGGRATND